ncbi:MAG: hypothetical protein CO158_04380 [Piscirickettsiaceae bacterium CG_4_9_14_3_um_filter_43_564]|nr:hypothetical protein [Thiomicrospira sp.]PIW78197.1 MAG: hypothetical protein CO000_02970 [Piscirickettsiaceae bacterium CG_4_8_14_3_um_filter_44_38]PIY76793.1 MAG: hypothetical protein COY84_04155 [Piscirickettsiaceae bacterium CG_4_10_14_0_8_um_filter_44_742]PJA66227.1 MAG: hypothetical protein CO158_04380 [Piscirickettsiaceae bacterium CG_4_9_14_3_um_filter_43_564]
MLRRLQQLFLLFLGLVLLYFVTIRVLLIWAHYAPDHFLPFVEKMTQTQIQIDHLDIEQTWLGFEFDVHGVKFRSETIQGHLEQGSGDVNLWALFGGEWHLGEQLFLNGLRVSGNEINGDQSGLQSKKWPKINQAWPVFYKSWQLINLKDIYFALPQGQERLTLGIESLQTYRGVKWNIGGVLSLQVNENEKSRIQLKGSFSPPGWNNALDGRASVNVLTPILLKPLYRLMPEEWQQTLPEGAFLGDVDLEMKRGDLAKLTIRTHAQNLVWPVNDDLLPKSFGIDLNWLATNQLKGKASENWQFQIENLRFDKAYVENISPIYIRLDQNQRLSFRAKEIDFDVIRPIADLIIRAFKYERFSDSIQQLKLVDVSGAIDVVDLKLSALKLKLPKLTMDAKLNRPGLTVTDLEIEKTQGNLWIRSPQPIQIRVNAINKGQALTLKLAEAVHLNFDHTQSLWQLDTLQFQLAQIPMSLDAQGNELGDLKMELQFAPERLATVKRYLPYPLMSSTLQAWLKESLVAGDGIKGRVKFQGNWRDFPFENGQGLFEVNAEIHNTTLKFQPDWPALTGFSAKLNFTPYQLVIDAENLILDDSLSLNRVPLMAQGGRVRVADLEKPNIAVQVQGQVHAAAKQVIDYLQKTPLLERIGLQAFVKDQVQATGAIQVDLDSIWIPVYGYAQQPEKVSGRVVLNQVDMTFFDVLSLTKLNGDIEFTESSVESKPLSASVFESPATIELSTQQNQIQITANGQLSINETFVAGVSPWQTQLSIPLKSAQALTIHNQVDLSRLVFNLPAPLSEAAMTENQVRPKTLISDINIKGDQLVLLFKAGDLMQMQGRYDLQDQQLSDFNILLNRQIEIEDVQVHKGGRVQGQLHRVDIDGWLKQMPKLQSYFENKLGLSAGEQQPLIFWQNSTVVIDQVQLFGTQFNQVTLDWSTLQGAEGDLLVLAAQSKDLKASVKQITPFQFAVNLTQLHMDIPTMDSAVSNVENLSCQAPKQPLKHPETKVFFNGENILINGKQIDKLNFELSNTDHSLNINQLEIFAHQVSAPFQGEYVYLKTDNSSQLSGSIKTKQVDALLTFIGFNKGFKGSKMQMGVNLSWMGGMPCFSLKGLSGSARFKMEEGTIKDAEPGFARVLGLLSFESLARRLRLKVNDFTEAGLVYDQIEGNGHFDQGRFVIKELELKAPAAKAKVFGQVNILSNELNLKAEVTPSIGSSLPAIAAISGFATPIAGFAAYVFMKYMPFVNEDIITYRYDVSGTFNEPVLDVKGPSVELFKFNKEQSPTPKGLDGFE